MNAVLLDFADPDSVAHWHPINDGVMGGVSSSAMRFDRAGHAVFAGNVSFANNGGFASVRCQHDDLGRRGVVAYVLEVRGDGKHYKLNLRTDQAFDGVNYKAHFHPAAGIWAMCRLTSADFRASWRGRRVPDAPLLDTAAVRQAGLMISDRQEGPFALAVRSLAVEIA